MNTIKITLAISVISLLISCQKREIIAQSNSSIKIEEKVEIFDTFIKKFYSDSIFQINRIIFPLESDIKDAREDIDTLNKSHKLGSRDNVDYPHNKKNWQYLKQLYFKGKNTIYSIDGVKYKRSINKVGKDFEEKIQLLDSNQDMIILRFRIIQNEWFLIDYLDEFESE